MDSLPGPYGLVLTNLVLNSIVHAYPDGKKGTVTFPRPCARAIDDVEIIVCR